MATKKKSAPKKLILFYITCPDLGVAEQLANLSIQLKLAACANILPTMHSIYKWQGKIDASKETVLILKTTNSRAKKLELFLSQNHPYETPCIAQISVDKINRSYAEWLSAAVL